MATNNNFDRIERLPPYVFAEVNSMKANERSLGEDVIDFGMGNPDTPTPNHIVDKLCDTIKDPKSHRYSVSRGILGLRKAQANYYKRRFNVDVNPDSEVIVTLGSKEGLANLASAITSNGDKVIVPNPSYPIHPYGFIIAGASVLSIDSTPNENFIKNLHKILSSNNNRAKALVLNYPNNPTTRMASLEFFKEVVDICIKYEVYILSDIAYAEIYFDGEIPPSILEVPRAKNIAIEFSSLSKTYSMPGWRVGFAVGNKSLVQALTKIKSYLDYGAFTPVQVASIAALNGPQECVNDIRSIYMKRRDILVEGLSRIGWKVESPKATMFVWAKLPDRFLDIGSLEFSKLLLKYGKVAVAPGVGFGENGEGFVRIGLVENDYRIRQAIKNIKLFFDNYKEK
ncbi:MAG: aminotransferase class I/II-fold pyridoxal phosphate-dependent enzyme [Alphaproteobacteria bacterium]|nr:MAG: aminotransferase class I/II-fold pyridoxal phosphate-dependent enzyme [Alphaproteobacteria bacterium]|tara:strand:+ start:1735 stop:2928 length:1194 start_codon:yes stop_codon:yes gene_type:complete